MAESITISQLVKGLYTDLQAWCKGKGIELRVARDAWHSYYLLSNAQDGFLCVLQWSGDDEFGGVIQCPVARNAFEVVLARFVGADPEPGLSAFEDATGPGSLLGLLDQLRARLLSYAPAQQTTLGRIRYKHTKPVVSPDGFPYSAYRITVELDAGVSRSNVNFVQPQ